MGPVQFNNTFPFNKIVVAYQIEREFHHSRIKSSQKVRKFRWDSDILEGGPVVFAGTVITLLYSKLSDHLKMEEHV